MTRYFIAVVAAALAACSGSQTNEQAETPMGAASSAGTVAAVPIAERQVDPAPGFLAQPGELLDADDVQRPQENVGAGAVVMDAPDEAVTTSQNESAVRRGARHRAASSTRTQRTAASEGKQATRNGGTVTATDRDQAARNGGAVAATDRDQATRNGGAVAASDRDRNADTSEDAVRREAPSDLNPLDQGSSDADIRTTQQIRKAIVANDALTFRSKNVKIITRDGQVTLMGAVGSETQRLAVERTAHRTAGTAQVVSQLQISN